jgi:hypothetical protein
LPSIIVYSPPADNIPIPCNIKIGLVPPACNMAMPPSFTLNTPDFALSSVTLLAP